MRKELIFAMMVFLVTMLCHDAYADSTASAVADQGQGQEQSQIGGMGYAGANAQQGQSQIQSSAGGSVNSSGNAIFQDSFNGAEPIRYLPVPSSVSFESYQAQHFGGPNYQDHGPNFVSMRQLVAAMNLVDLSMKVEGEGDIRIVAQMLGGVGATVSSVDFQINDGEVVNGGFKPIALLTVETEAPDNSNSASLALAIGKKAKALGASKVVFLTEGSSKELTSWGVGIGLSYNYATVGSDASDSGSVGAGGTGWSMGKAGYDSLIYLTAIVGN